MGIFTRLLLPLSALIAIVCLTACDNGASPDKAVTTAATAADVITITDPRIRATAPGQKVSGAFMTLSNSSAIPFALKSAGFAAATTVEIHETSMQDRVMRMMKVDQIDIPASGSVELKPGSYHIMLMGLGKQLNAGTTEDLTLIFSDDSKLTVQASVSDLNNQD